MLSKKIKIYNKRYEKISKIGEGAYGKVMFVVDIAQASVSNPNKIKLTIENHQEILKIPVFAIKKSKESKQNQNLQVLPKIFF